MTVDRIQWAVSIVLVSGLFASCVTIQNPVEPLAETTLIVTRTVNGATINWQTQPGVVYTVLYAERRDAQARWKPLPGAINLQGTGHTFTFTETLPYQQKRYYRLHMVPALPGP